jgi:hypothetical protein
VVAVYVTVSVYVPFGFEVSAFTLYHTVVVSLVATAAVVLSVFGEELDGTPAHFVLLLVALVIVE